MKRFVDLYVDEGSKNYAEHTMAYVGKINVSSIVVIHKPTRSITVYSNAVSDFAGKEYRPIVLPALAVGVVHANYYISESDACALETDND